MKIKNLKRAIFTLRYDAYRVKLLARDLGLFVRLTANTLHCFDMRFVAISSLAPSPSLHVQFPLDRCASWDLPRLSRLNEPASYVYQTLPPFRLVVSILLEAKVIRDNA